MSTRTLPITILLLLFAALVPAEGKTYAVLVGVSKYATLPKDLWLQYPDIDAETFSKFLATPRGGSVPADQMLVLTNEKATTGAVRKAFTAFQPGKDDTIYILVAGHGTVSSEGAYILLYDSDPGNLAKTGFPMGELRSLVEAQTAKAGHVVFLADVCHASSIAGQKSTAIGAVVVKMGDDPPGEMLGLMAARPSELSLENPEFGGGHGAFTWSVLQGLSGAADADKDGFVNAGELIDFVTTGVPKLTRDQQHPRDFGNMENGTKLADLSKPGLALP